MAARNRTMDVMLALGIVYVVMGHSYQPKIFLLPAYTFQVAIFFFISGYFFKAQNTGRGKLDWSLKKFRHLLIPYFIFNLFFALLTGYLAYFGINLGGPASWYNFFVTPFLSGQQYFLFLAAWFVPQLFLVHILAQWLVVQDRRAYIWILLVFSLLAAAFWGFKYSSPPTGLTLVAVRSLISLAVYLLGAGFRIIESRVQSWLVSPFSFAALYIVYVALEIFWNGFTYQLEFLQFLNGPVVTLLGTLSAILMIYIISYYIAQSLPENSFLLQIGRHTFSVMALHLLIFWLINLILNRVGLIPYSALSKIFFQYRPERYWFIYSGLGIVLPVYLALAYERLVSAAKNKFKPSI